MESEILTKNFKLNELTRSSVASREHIKNIPSGDIIDSLRNLCTMVLQPLRDFYKLPIIVSSGYRCPTLNNAVGGSRTSQHLKGEAADIVFPNISVAIDWVHFIMHNCDFDQLLLEHNRRTGARWIHVSCRKDRRNRHDFRILEVS